MVDLRKIKEYCASKGAGCRKGKGWCEFLDYSILKCRLLCVPEKLDIEKIEKAYNKLFGGSNG